MGFRTRRTMGLPALLCLLCAASVAMGDLCPPRCQCSDKQNLKVYCSGQHLLTPPVTTRSTLTLDLSHNSLGPIIEKDFPHMPNLTSLDLSYNALSRLLGCTLSGMLKLKAINLRGNRLTLLPDSLFTDASKVEHLDLSHNLFTQLPDDAFRNLPELVSLDLSHNKLTNVKLGNRFQVPRHIQVIDFSFNNFEAIQENAFEIASGWEPGFMRTLNLANCSISDIKEDALSKIPTLNSLDLSGNSNLSFSVIKALVKKLESGKLEKLMLTHLNLTSINSLFTEVRTMALKFLNVSFNKINELPTDVFSTIRSLSELDVSHNALKELDAGLSGLENLQVLKMSHNQMTAFQGEPIQYMVKLHTLDVSHNELASAIKVNFSSLVKLKYLNVSNNLLPSVIVPQNTSSLKHLDYHSNRISQFSGLNDSMQLETCDLSDNLLTTVVHFLFNSGMNLKLVNLSKNSIISLDPRAFQPHSPQVIDLSHNSLTELHYSNWLAAQKLYLSHNHLSQIDSQALYGMIQLEELDLSHNRLTALDPILFEYLTGLRHLSLAHNVLNSVMWFDLFRHLELLVTLDLSHNNISEVEESMLLPLPKIQMLSLQGNDLHSINPRVFRDLTEIKIIDFGNNPFYCSCDLLTFQHWLSRTKITIRDLNNINSTAYQCKSPPQRVGLHILKWNVEEFECNRSMLFVVIFGSLGLFLIIMAVIGAAGYRILKNMRRVKAEKLRKLLELREKRDKKADHVRLTSQKLSEEIRDAMQRKEKLGQRLAVVKDRSNGYVPWIGGMKEREKRRGERDDGRERIIHDGASRGSQDKGWSYKKYERLEGGNLADPVMMRWGGKDMTERSHRPIGEAQEGYGNRKVAEHRRGQNEGDLANTAPLHINADRYRASSGRQSLEYDRRPTRDLDAAALIAPKDNRYRYMAAEPVRISGPYLIQPATRTMPGGWDNVESWRGQRVWTIEGYGRSRSQVPKRECYLTMPVGGREMAGLEREHVPHTRIDDPSQARYVPEVHFEERKLKHGYLRQHGNEGDYRRYHEQRSHSYHSLPQDYPDNKAPVKTDRAQRQYESIDQTRRESVISQRSASQPFLYKENESDWL